MFTSLHVSTNICVTQPIDIYIRKLDYILIYISKVTMNKTLTF